MASGRVVSSWVPTLALEGIKHAVYFDCLHGCGVGQKLEGRENERKRTLL